ncbi:MAG: TMAO reductase system periplasmic protein TorT, partial [Pseudomonadota bacterium]
MRQFVSLCLWASMLMPLATIADTSTNWRLETWDTPFDYNSPSRIIQYEPAQPAAKPWHMCISYPHLKDSYWLNVNYGMVEEARRLGVAFTLVEAGGYPNLSKQRDQIEQCTSAGTNALIVGTVSFEGLSETIVDISQTIPVLATVNDITDIGITAKSGVSWKTMGEVAGAYLAKLHPLGTAAVTVAWFPGPEGAGWVDFIERGFRAGLEGSAVEVIVTKWGDTGKEIQRTLVQEALESHPEVDYLVGNALMAEASVSTLRNRGLENDIEIISTYFTPAVYRGIRRGRILAAPTDAPVIQGRLSINQAVRVLEGRPYIKHAGPEILMITQDNWKSINIG